MVGVNNVPVRKLRKTGTKRRHLCTDELFDAINIEHLSTGHGARDITHNKTNMLYANVTKEVIQCYVHLCVSCNLKKSKVRKSLVVKPMISNDMNSRCQVDLIDMQTQPPDGEFKFILNYQDHLPKFVVLRPLYHKTAEEVVEELIEIVYIFGSPHILQSDNGREFSNKIVKKIVEMWPGCKLVHGKPRHSQSQGSVERANRDTEAILACWMKYQLVGCITLRPVAEKLSPPFGYRALSIRSDVWEETCRECVNVTERCLENSGN